jgi:DNA polymerase-3 subunit epsilon
VEFIECCTVVGHHIDDHVEMINAQKGRNVRTEEMKLWIDIMHQKLNDITDIRFSLMNYLKFIKFQNYNNICFGECYKALCYFLEIKVKIGYQKCILFFISG